MCQPPRPPPSTFPKAHKLPMLQHLSPSPFPPGTQLHLPDLLLLAVSQVPDNVKRDKADHVIDTGCSLTETEAQVEALLESLRGKGGTAIERLLITGKEVQHDNETKAAAGGAVAGQGAAVAVAGEGAEQQQ